MAHYIGKHEDIAGALHRLILGDLAGAQAELAANGSAESRIHHVRQRLKRVRSLLRIERPALQGVAKDAKRAVGRAAKLLAGARDADAAAASARGLKEAEGPDDRMGLDRLVATLDRQAAAAHRAVPPVEEVGRQLARIETELAGHAVEFDGGQLFHKAVTGSYRRGRRAMRRAESSLATPDLHRWRKEVKDLWHLLRLARRRLPDRRRHMERRLAELGELLGLDHDHAMLAERLALSPEPEPALMRQLALIARERRAIEVKAFALGAKLYQKPVRDFDRATRLT